MTLEYFLTNCRHCSDQCDYFREQAKTTFREPQTNGTNFIARIGETGHKLALNCSDYNPNGTKPEHAKFLNNIGIDLNGVKIALPQNMQYFK